MKKLIIVLSVMLLLCQTVTAQQPLRVLFVGNSYTFYNNLPEMLKGIATPAGQAPAIEVAMTARGGQTLREHWDERKALELIEQSHWDYVILQEQSALGAPMGPDGISVINDPQTFHYYARLFDREIKKTGAKTAFLLTWARKNFPKQQEELNAAYLKIADELHAMVIPAGIAWQNVRSKEPDLELYNPDLGHPSPLGSYLTACLIYAFLTGNSPEGLPGRVTGHPADGGVVDTKTTVTLADLNRSELGIVQRYAFETYNQFRDSSGK